MNTPYLRSIRDRQRVLRAELESIAPASRERRLVIEAELRRLENIENDILDIYPVTR